MHMRRMRAVGKGWMLGALALVALVVAGAVQARVGGGTQDEAATVSRDVAGGGAARSSSEPSEPFVAKGQVVPLPPDSIGTTPIVPGAPRVVRTADLRVRVEKGAFPAAFDRVAAVATANGGFVTASSTASAGKVGFSLAIAVRSRPTRTTSR